MAEIRTTRMRLVQWTEGTDSPQRVDFNETFLNVETLAAIDQQGTIGNRSTPSKTGMYYFATDEGILYRSDGQAWAVVGSSTLSHLIRAARTDSVSLTIQAITGQTADLLRITTTSGGTLVRVRPNGDVLAGALRVSQSARTTTASDTAPTDSAVTVDNNSTSMWNTTAKNTTGNTAGYFRAIRGTSTVFSVAADGSVSTPMVTLTSEPTATTHATTKTYVDAAVASRTYALTSDQLTGVLPVAKGGTGRSTVVAGAYFRGNAAGDGYEGVTPANVRTDIDAATSSHGHALTDANITGVLPVSQGGTGATTQEAARTALDVPSTSITINTGAGLTGGGTLAASRTLQVVFEGNGTATTAARSDHGHALTDANVTGVLPWEKAPKPIRLGTANLNDIRENGVYHQDRSADASTSKNYPYPIAGLLVVHADGYMVYQTFTAYSDNGYMYRRTYYNGSWYSWRKIPVQDDLDYSVYTIPLSSDRTWSGHGYAPQLIREGKRRTLRGRVSPKPTTYNFEVGGPEDGGVYRLFKIPTADLPSLTVGGHGQVSGFAAPGYARVEIQNLDHPTGVVIASVSRQTSWIGLDGISWYID